MGVLRDKINERDAQRSAAQLLDGSEAARQQKTDVQDYLTGIQSSFPDGIPAQPSNRQLFIDIGQNLEILAALNNKLPIFKTDLIALKSKVNDTDFEAEIQAEIDLL